MKKTFKVLCLFDYNAVTGFGTVSKNIKEHLKNHFKGDLKLDICAINYFGEPYVEDDGTDVISASKSASKHDDFGRFGFLKILNDSDEYDGIFIMQDLGVITPIVELLKNIKERRRKENKKGFKSIFYFPIDCKIVKNAADGLEFFDCLVAYNQFGRNEVVKLNPKLKGKVKIVPHGNNSKDFYPISKDDIAPFRKEYFGDNADELFIISNISRNQSRKDIPTTIFSFIEAKKCWNEIGLSSKPFLYLHMNPKDKLGWDLVFLLSQTKLVEGEDYKFMEGEFVSNEVLNKIYNASDLILSTSMAEGWGLIFNESAATKRPIIVPNHTSFKEMGDGGKRAYLIDDLIPCCNKVDSVIRLQSDFNSVADMICFVAEVLEKKHEDLYLLEKYNERIENAYKWVQELEWKKVCEKWIQLFKETYL